MNKIDKYCFDMEKNLKGLEDVSDNSLIEGMSDLSFADI
jgi:hypothetical protein